MAVLTLGSGPNRVIALHDWFGTGQAFTEMLQWLDLGKFTVACPDYRGYGDRMDDAGAFTIEEITADVIGLADELGWDRFHLIGHSMGAKVAQLVAATSSSRVDRILALTPVPPGALGLDEAGLAMFRSATQDASVREGIIRNSTGNRHSDTFYRLMVEASIARSTRDAFGAYFESWANVDITTAVTGLKNRVLIVVGEHDPVLNRVVMEQAFVPHYPNSEIMEMPASGHYPTLETPVALATVIDRFFS